MSEPETPVSGRDPEVGGVVASDASTGRVLGERYRLGARRGIGLDIAIFEAVDLATDRLVAVKIIHPDICATPGFTDRFAAMVEHVQRTRHPNLVDVVGSGQAIWSGQSVHYVVCENLTGGSLRDLRDRGRQLSPSQVVMIGLDACRGLEVAHRSGLTHGDIRPGNLVFGDDGRLRVADLGLAALVAVDIAAHPSTTSIDRAKYASPEQAVGGVVGTKSDVYSLSLCLLEAASGALPFVGDSTVATLSNRVDRLLPVSADLGPLAAVLERGGRPHEADRYTVSELGRALHQAAEKLPRPAPIALMAAGRFAEAAPLEVAADPTGEITRDITRDIARDTGRPVIDAPPPLIAPGVAAGVIAADANSMTADLPRPSATDSATAAPVPPPPLPTTEPPLLRERGPRRKLLALVAVIALAMAAGGTFAWFAGRDTSNVVPELVGLAQGEALNMVSEFGWAVTVTNASSDDVPVGSVISTEPVAGTSIDRGGALTIVVSSGPAPRVLPELAGLSVDAASAALAELNLSLQLHDQPFDETVPEGVVISWSVPDQPSLVAGDTVLPGTVVVVSVSAGPAPRTVPDLTGFSLADATAQLTGLALGWQQAPDEFSDQAPGAVVRQDPAPGTVVPRDTTITIVISKGQDLVTIPALADLDLQQASAALVGAGLVVGQVTGDPAGVVVRAEANGVELGANAPLPRGTAVNLTLQVPAPPATVAG